MAAVATGVFFRGRCHWPRALTSDTPMTTAARPASSAPVRRWPCRVKAATAVRAAVRGGRGHRDPPRPARAARPVARGRARRGGGEDGAGPYSSRGGAPAPAPAVPPPEAPLLDGRAGHPRRSRHGEQPEYGPRQL